MWFGGGWWLIDALVMVVCIYMMIRMMGGHGDPGHEGHGGANHHEGASSASEILAARFARGEISQEEFEQRRRVLEGSSPHDGAMPKP
jgi:putative membrane protein